VLQGEFKLPVRRPRHRRVHAGTGKAKTVIWRWQERFSAEGVASLWRDKTRPSRIPPLAPEIAERVVALTLAGSAPDLGWRTSPNRRWNIRLTH
jgi:hypothetical protein